MKKLLSICSLVILSACGGSSEPTTSIDKYAGQWASCDSNHVKRYVTFTQPGPSTLDFKILEQVYQRADCSGVVLGTLDYKMPATYSYKYTKNYTIYNYPTLVTWNYADVDVGSVSNPKMTVEIAGSGVRIIGNQTCIIWSPSEGLCTDGTEGNADFIDQTGFILSNGILYVAAQSDSIGHVIYFDVYNQYFRQ